VPGRVIVVGSVNVDLVATVARLPAPGETVTGGTFAQHPGGKGGNQATAAARVGADVSFVGAVGDDPLGAGARASLGAEGVDVAELATVDASTGVALILVDAAGENLIAVASGANGRITPAAVTAALERLGTIASDVVVVGNEIPADAVLAALDGARRRGATTILNPAPASGIEAAHLALADLLVPNRVELAGLAGTDATERRSDDETVVEGARTLLAREAGEAGEAGGVRVGVIVTLGQRGAVVVRRDAEPLWIAAPSVTAVDTVGAGDTFVGALAAALADGGTVEDAALRAVLAASFSTTRPGARGGMPTSAELAAMSAR
jgi:ribokinase